MKKLSFALLILMFNLSTFAQQLNFNFVFYSQFEYTGKQKIDTNILKLDGFSYASIGFGKNDITVDFTNKKITNDYFIDENFKGQLIYENLSNRKNTNGVITFQAQRIHPHTQLLYTEYFIINENALPDSPYLISYWHQDGKIEGVIVPKSAVTKLQ